MRLPQIHPLRPLLALTLAIGAPGCGVSDSAIDAVSPGIVAGGLSIAPMTDGFSVRNQTERPVYLFSLERNMAALVDWIPCTGGTGCEVLVQGEIRTIPWSAVFGADASRSEYLVYWWNVEMGSDGRARAVNMQNTVVRR
jgi:hypothetical protein